VGSVRSIMEDWKEAFKEEWDAVVLGTGMKVRR
jgi:hypothetical protein